MIVEKQLWVDAVIEAALAHALNELSLFVVDNQSTVGRVQNMTATDRNLRVDLSVTIG